MTVKRLNKPTTSNRIAETKPRAQVLAERLDGRRIGAFILKLTHLRPVKRRSGWLYLTLRLADQGGAISHGPLMSGIVSGGGRGVAPWLECRIYPQVDFASGKTVDARAEGLEAEIVEALGKIIPPGGHIMVDYEHPGQQGTFAELILRVPPAASHLGALMFRAGFRGHFKDWYFSEGGHEGPRKLQANKPPDAAAARQALAAHRKELGAFIKRPPPEESSQAATIREAQERARALLKELRR
jgi:hypothetical protein